MFGIINLVFWRWYLFCFMHGYVEIRIRARMFRANYLSLCAGNRASGVRGWGMTRYKGAAAWLLSWKGLKKGGFSVCRYSSSTDSAYTAAAGV